MTLLFRTEFAILKESQYNRCSVLHINLLNVVIDIRLYKTVYILLVFSLKRISFEET
jgi:hypothetical protein